MTLHANQRWSLPVAIRNLLGLASVQPHSVEEPAHPDDVIAHQTLARATAPLKVVAGKHVSHRVPFKNFMQAQAAQHWNEALPIGNGQLGGMVFDGRDDERIDLNETTLWSGFPRNDLNANANRFLEPIRALLRQGEWHEAQTLIEANMLRRSPEAYQPLGTLRITRQDQLTGDLGIGELRLPLERFNSRIASGI